jgi:predicted kinase
MLNRDEYRAAVEQHVRDNLTELSRGEHGLAHCLVARVHATQLIVLGLCRDWFDRRVDEGRVIEGHGDLRPEHVYFAPEPIVIDCLAFSRELRTLDEADEIAFLAMELRRLGSVALAEGLVAAFGQHAADDPPRGLWAFYQAYRACVRAKVAVLRAAQLDEPLRGAERSAARAYLELADSVAESLARPMCIVVRGLSGTGKSTLAAALSRKLGIVHLQTDRIRKQLFPGAAPTKYGQGCYTTAARSMVYDAMRAQACERLSQRQSVILDGTFLSAASRAAVAEVATRRHAVTALLACHCSVEVAAERLAKRVANGFSESDARMETLRRQADEEEPDPAGMHAVRIDTTAPIERQVEVACEALGGAFNLAIGERCGGALRLNLPPARDAT